MSTSSSYISQLTNPTDPLVQKPVVLLSPKPTPDWAQRCFDSFAGFCGEANQRCLGFGTAVVQLILCLWSQVSQWCGGVVLEYWTMESIYSITDGLQAIMLLLFFAVMYLPCCAVYLVVSFVPDGSIRGIW